MSRSLEENTKNKRIPSYKKQVFFYPKKYYLSSLSFSEIELEDFHSENFSFTASNVC